MLPLFENMMKIGVLPKYLDDISRNSYKNVMSKMILIEDGNSNPLRACKRKQGVLKKNVTAADLNKQHEVLISTHAGASISELPSHVGTMIFTLSMCLSSNNRYRSIDLKLHIEKSKNPR